MDAKINLSREEMELVQNKEWLLSKRNIIHKVYELLGQLHEGYQQFARTFSGQLSYLPIEKMGKISRGENYKGLPYLILDYPASFEKKKITAVRTFFWWGNFFSISLHLSGLQVSDKILEGWMDHFEKNGFAISVNTDQWDHDFSEENFEPFQKHKKEYFLKIKNHGILRVAKKVQLSDWEAAPQQLQAAFEMIIRFLRDQLPSR